MRDDGAVNRWNVIRGASLAIAAAALLCGIASAQTTEAGLIARLQDKPLFLRGMWNEDHLKFDAEGNPSATYKAVSFTESGFDFTAVKLKGDKLRVQGQRVALEFGSDGNIQRLPLVAQGYSGKVTIEIDAIPGTDFGKALDAIFAPDLASLVPTLPAYWQRYARSHFLPTSCCQVPAEAKTTSLNTGEPLNAGGPKNPSLATPARVGGSAKAPRLLKKVDPIFPPVARAFKYSGNVQVDLWIAEDGSVQHLSIAKPVGMGLDEAALQAVSQYKFAPATQNDKPVKVDLTIDVNFQIF